MIHRPNSELVVVQWLNTIAELARTPNYAATQLPADNTTWGASGFVTVDVTGGDRDFDIYAGRPVITLDVWAVQSGGSKPLWGKAWSITEAIISATQDEANLRRLLTLTSRGKSFGTARVLEVYPLTEPHRVPNDPSAYAHIVMDLQFHWVGVSNG